MTKSRGVGRGGKRSGSGQKKRPKAPAIEITIPTSGLGSDELAKRYVDLAIETLATIAANGASEAARVAAADKLLDRAEGKPKSAVIELAEDEVTKPADKWADLDEAARPN